MHPLKHTADQTDRQFQIIHDWSQWMSLERRLSSRTLDIYCSCLHKFRFFLQNHHARDIDSEDLCHASLTDFRAFLAYLRSEGLQKRSIALSISALKNFYTYINKQKGIINNDIDLLQSPKYKKSLPRPISKEDCTTILENVFQSDHEWVNARDKALVALLYGCGLRISEALLLSVKDLNQGDIIRIKGKGNKERLVPVLPMVHKCIQDYVDLVPFNLEPNDPMFRGVRGKPLHPAIFQKKMREIRPILGLSPTATPHALRHSFATHLLGEGVNLRHLAELLGHASLSTTQVYTQVDTARLAKAIHENHPRGS